MEKFRELVLHHHLGLGDHIICNGMVYRIIEKYGVEQLYLMVKDVNLPTVNKLYEDSEVVIPVSIPYETYEQEQKFVAEYRTDIPHLDIIYTGGGSEFFDIEFYGMADVDFQDRWDKFKMPKDDSASKEFFGKFIKDKEYCLVHCQGSPGSYDLNVTTDLPIYYIESGLTSTILDWADVIKNAKEIHCIDSSIIHLADSLDLTAEKLYYHDVGRGSKFHLINEWTLVDAT
jgi:hypothetical protein